MDKDNPTSVGTTVRNVTGWRNRSRSGEANRESPDAVSEETESADEEPQVQGRKKSNSRARHGDPGKIRAREEEKRRMEILASLPLNEYDIVWTKLRKQRILIVDCTRLGGFLRQLMSQCPVLHTPFYRSLLDGVPRFPAVTPFRLIARGSIKGRGPEVGSFVKILVQGDCTFPLPVSFLKHCKAVFKRDFLAED